MKSGRTVSWKHVAAAGALAVAQMWAADTARATTFTWNGGGGNANWSTTGNWTGGAPASDAATDLIFAGTTNVGTSGTPLDQDIAAPIIINTLSFNSGAGAFFLGGGQIQFGGALSALTQNDDSVQTIGNAINISTATVFGGSGAGNVALNGNITGSGGLTKTGTSTFLLTAANGYAGIVNVNAGTLQLSGANGSLASATNYNISGGSLLLNNLTAAGGNKNGRLNSVANLTLSGGSLVINGADASATNTTNSIANLGIGAGFSTLTVSRGGTNTNALTAASIARTGKGTVLFSGTGLGASSQFGRVALTSTSGLNFSGATTTNGGAGTADNVRIIPWMIGDTGTGSGNTFVTYDTSTGLRPLDTTAEFVANSLTAGNNVRLTSNVDPGDVSINSLVLAGGNLTMGNNDNVTIASGAVLYAATNSISGGNPNTSIEFGAAEAIITVVSGATGTLTPTAVNGSGGLTKSGAGTLLINISNNIGGDTNINAGTLRIAATDSLVTTEDLNIGGAGTFDLNNFNQTVAALTGSGTIGNSATGGSGSSTLTISHAGTATFGGVIQNVLGSGTRTVTLTKTGAGTQILSGNNTYTGANVISGGALYYNGTNSGLGNFTWTGLTASATLGGTGTIGLGASQTVNAVGGSAANRAVINPGDNITTISQLTIGSAATNGVTLGNNSTLAIDIGAGAANNDVLHVVGTLNTASASNILALNMAPANQGRYTIADFTVGITQGANTSANGGFAAVTGLNSFYRLAVTSGANGKIEVIQRANQMMSTDIAPAGNAFVSNNLNVQGTIANAAVVNGSDLAVGLTSTGQLNVSGLGTAFNLAAASNTPFTGTINTGTTAGSRTWQISNADALAVTTHGSIGGSINVYDHAAATATSAGSIRVTEGQSGSTQITLANPTAGSSLRDAAVITDIAINGGFGTDFSGPVEINAGSSNNTFTAFFSAGSQAAVNAGLSKNLNVTYGDKNVGFLGANNDNQTAALAMTAIVDKLAEHVSTDAGMAAQGRSFLGTAQPTQVGPAAYFAGTVTNINGGTGANKGHIAIDMQPTGASFSPDAAVVLIDFASTAGLSSLTADLDEFGYNYLTSGGNLVGDFAGYDLQITLGTAAASASYFGFDFSKYDSGNLNAVNIAVVPEPSALALAGIGAASLLLRRRRR